MADYLGIKRDSALNVSIKIKNPATSHTASQLILPTPKYIIPKLMWTPLISPIQFLPKPPILSEAHGRSELAWAFPRLLSAWLALRCSSSRTSVISEPCVEGPSTLLLLNRGFSGAWGGQENRIQVTPLSTAPSLQKQNFHVNLPCYHKFLGFILQATSTYSYPFCVLL